MVQKGKVEETILESVPQLVIQVYNTYLLGEIMNMPLFTIFSISLSALSLSNTVWYYAYWNLFRCKPIRDVPSSLSLYNYKLSGVKDGRCSFSKPSGNVDEIEMGDTKLLSVTIGTVLNDSSRIPDEDSKLDLPKKNVSAASLEIEIVRPDHQDNGEDFLVDPEMDAPAASNSMVALGMDEMGCEIEVAGVPAGHALDTSLCASTDSLPLSNVHDELRDAQDVIAQLQLEKRRMLEEMNRMQQELLLLSSNSRDSSSPAAAISRPVSELRTLRRLSHDDPFQMVRLFLLLSHCFVLILHQVWHAALKLQSVARGHFGRRLFRNRCQFIQQQLLNE
jgi:hypothetical protein